MQTMVRRWVESRDELRALICERRDALDLAHTTIDAISGVPDGYTSKVLAPDPVRNFGPTSLAAILGALALRIVRVEIVEDPQAAANVSGRWVPRRRRPNLKCAPRCVVSDVGEAQRSFNLVHPEEEQVPMSQTRLITTRVDEALAEQVEQAAAKDRRPVSAFVRNILADALAKPPAEQQRESAQ
jgi:hypothetical protein